jgi:hypothetical protein
MTEAEVTGADPPGDRHGASDLHTTPLASKHVVDTSSPAGPTEPYLRWASVVMWIVAGVTAAIFLVYLFLVAVIVIDSGLTDVTFAPLGLLFGAVAVGGMMLTASRVKFRRVWAAVMAILAAAGAAWLLQVVFIIVILLR